MCKQKPFMIATVLLVKSLMIKKPNIEKNPLKIFKNVSKLFYGFDFQAETPYLHLYLQTYGQKPVIQAMYGVFADCISVKKTGIAITK